MAAVVVASQGRQAQVIRRNGHSGANSFGSVQVKFLDTGEIKNLPDTVLPRAVYEDADTDIVQVAMMTADEAKNRVQAVKNAAADMGRHLLELKEREGWRALGYANWTAFLEGEFQQSRQQLYEIMAAAPVLERLSATAYKLSTKAAYALSRFDEDLQPIILETTQARYGDVTESRITRVGDVIQTLVITGHVDTGNGTSTPIDAALDNEDAEAHKRQQVYIAEKQNAPQWHRLFSATGSLDDVITELDWMQFERQTAGRNVRLMLHVEADDAS